MVALGIVGSVLVLLLILGPQFWIGHVMKKNNADRQEFPGTGGELAKHLVEHFGLNDVGVELTDRGAHYDPEDRMVRLTQEQMDGRSITAVAVAAHEVGHAMQHQDGLDGMADGGLMRRQRLIGLAVASDKIASIFFLAAPVLAIFARSPVALLLFVGVGVALLAVRILVHLVTLPVEYDASFTRALPILREGGYLSEDDLPAARSVLKAAAFTYVAAAAMSLLDLARWVRILR